MIQKRDAFTATAAAIDPARAHFIDEAGTHVAMTRDFGRAERGDRVVEHVPRNRGTVTTMIASLCIHGVGPRVRVLSRMGARTQGACP